MFEAFQLSLPDWGFIFFCAMLIGMSKAGVPGVSIVAIPILAILFGGKQSTGILLPMLIMADVLGVSYYHRHANWKHILKALPWAILGVLIAMLVGNKIDDQQFKQIIAIIIFASIGLMIWRDRRKGRDQIPEHWWFAALMGLAGGFATMIGNAAGPIFAIYLLALRLPKNEYIGTAAWFFIIINVFKFPLHVFVWHTISWPSLLMDLVTLPAIALGAFLGFWMVKKITVSLYRWIVIAVTALSAFIMLV
ncbi:MAG: sulfite exporter TauE/SafE family protein [Prolixibacteraceae bacterium]